MFRFWLEKSVYLKLFWTSPLRASAILMFVQFDMWNRWLLVKLVSNWLYISNSACTRMGMDRIHLNQGKWPQSSSPLFLRFWCAPALREAGICGIDNIQVLEVIMCLEFMQVSWRVGPSSYCTRRLCQFFIMPSYRSKLTEWKWNGVLQFPKLWALHSVATLSWRPLGPQTSTPVSSPSYLEAAALKISAGCHHEGYGERDFAWMDLQMSVTMRKKP